MSIRLPNFLSRKRYFRETDGSLRLLQNGGRGVEVVVRRAQCQYRCFDLGNLPENLRRDRLGVLLDQWSTSQDFDTFVSWNGGHAQVWSCTPGLSDEAFFIPESVLYGQPQSVSQPLDAVLLVKLGSGAYEGRVWREGILHATQCWSDLPDQRAWLMFLRGAGGEPGQVALPVALEPPMLEQPWCKPDSNALARFSRNESSWVATAAAIALLVFAWQLVLIWDWNRVIAKASHAYDLKSEETGAVLDAKQGALANLAIIDELGSLYASADQLSLQVALAQAFAGEAVQVVSWRYKNGELEVGVSGAKSDLTTYVQKLESEPFFSEVTIKSGRRQGEIIISMNAEHAGAKG